MLYVNFRRVDCMRLPKIPFQYHQSVIVSFSALYFDEYLSMDCGHEMKV